MRVKRNFRRRFYLSAIIFTLFQKSLTPQETTGTLDERDEDATDDRRIRCPLCDWQPSASSLWSCEDCAFPEYFVDGCGMVWNTFETRGRCPGCGHQWRWTSCLRCEGWSPHEDWYTEERT